MTYIVKEIFYSIQGEGANVGRAAIFCRFSGCNLWSGKKIDQKLSLCNFCDTDFIGINGENGGKYYNALDLTKKIKSLWPKKKSYRFVICTGGEPMLQLDESLLKELHKANFKVAIETNGSIPVLNGIDWICVSPKSGVKLAVNKGNEIKIVVPQNNQCLYDYENMQFEYFFIQPMDGPSLNNNIQYAINLCHKNPKWRLSIQIHKYLNIQ